MLQHQNNFLDNHLHMLNHQVSMKMMLEGFVKKLSDVCTCALLFDLSTIKFEWIFVEERPRIGVAGLPGLPGT